MSEGPSVVAAAEAQALTLPPHRIVREGDEDWPRSVVCDGPVGSKCRLVCAANCDSEWWPCGPEDARHPMKDGDGCNVVWWIEEDVAAYDYVGPIDVSWDFDHYAWRPSADDRPDVTT